MGLQLPGLPGLPGIVWSGDALPPPTACRTANRAKSFPPTGMGQMTEPIGARCDMQRRSFDRFVRDTFADQWVDDAVGAEMAAALSRSRQAAAISWKRTGQARCRAFL